MPDGRGILPPCKAKNHRNPLWISRFFNAARRLKARPDGRLRLWIQVLRDKYRLKELLLALHMSKSSYCYQENCLHKPDKYKELRTEVQTIFRTADKRYGYRRIHASLKKSGRPVSEKVVRRLMKEEGLAVLYVKRKKYNAYAGDICSKWLVNQLIFQWLVRTA